MMGAITGIEWCDHTFNPWRGCEKVSAGCAHCYAETLSKRNPAVLGEWGKDGRRVIAAESAWREPLKWDRHAAKAGVRRRVFCGSMCDVFEHRADLVEARARLFDLIAATPNLDWLLLTKRPENVERLWMQFAHGMVSNDPYLEDVAGARRCFELSAERWPNVWIGTSVEDQASAEARVPALLRVDAAVRFLSCEPLLGPVDLTREVRPMSANGRPLWPSSESMLFGIDWVICGGESGAKARPMHPDWARGLRDQCVAAGVPFFFKQWGAWVAEILRYPYTRHLDKPVEYHNEKPPTKHGWGCLNRSGSWYPETTTWNGNQFDPESDYECTMIRVGKKAAGRELDGRTWEEFPGGTA